jgi:DNA (cytosine-5)-methyltransferase 1
MRESANHPSLPGETLSVAGLFAGIGGIELGFHQAGHRTELLCEIEPGARAVLAHHFPGVEMAEDVRELGALPAVDLVAGGFPCQDLSQAGRTVGIGGERSGLVGEVFRLIEDEATCPRWVLLENVPFMLQLDQGKAMRFLTTTLEAMGFTWAYRVVNTQAFGLPQRRQRVLFLASRTEDPRGVLFGGEDPGERNFEMAPGLAYGFYWTEGQRGLGWGIDAVPTIKGGSTVGIASPPAIWMPDGRLVLPDIRDAERMQGFPADWTLPGVTEGGVKKGYRWKMVGNAVSVPVAKWLGDNLRSPRTYDHSKDRPLVPGKPWPKAAWGRSGEQHGVDVSMFPVHAEYQHLAEFLQYETTLLSERATAGFLSRMRAGSLHFRDGFEVAVEAHLKLMSKDRVLV